MDNTNFDLIKTLSVRANAEWHDDRYLKDVGCQGCREVYTKLREMDRAAINLLSEELESHVRDGAFPGNSILRAAH